MQRPRLVLASRSPRRQAYLHRLGLPFVVRTGEVEEISRPGEPPHQMVARLARAKAEAVALCAGEIVIAADTVVVLEDTVLGKPEGPGEARWMLMALRGRDHLVHTGLALRRPGEVWSDTVSARVHMRPYSEAEVAAYVASGRPLDKAGAYGIQDRGFDPVDRVEGCYMTVVGLPLCHLARALLRWAVPLSPLPLRDCRIVRDGSCPLLDGPSGSHSRCPGEQNTV